MEKIFNNLTVSGTYVVMLLLAASAYKAHDSTYICKHSAAFLTESIGVGLGVAIPTAIIGYMRNATVFEIVDVASIAFMTFFIFNILMEMSGYNKPVKNIKSPLPLYIIMILLGVLAFFGIALIQNMDTAFMNVIIQSVTMMIGMILPFFMIRYSHGTASKDLAWMWFAFMLAFFGGNVALQTGGFWTKVFPMRLQ